HMIVHHISRSLAGGKRLKILSGQLESACDTRVNVVALLEIYVLEEVPAHNSSGNGVTVHLASVQVGNRALDWHQSLTQVLVNSRVYLWALHKRNSVTAQPD